MKDRAVSEVIGIILIVLLAVTLSAIILAVVMGLAGKSVPESTYAPFQVEVGRDGSSGGAAKYPYIILYQMAGDDIKLGNTQQWTPLKNTSINLIDPTGKNYPIASQQVLTTNPSQQDIKKGKTYYIFRGVAGGYDYFITDLASRVKTTAIMDMIPKGKWRLVISDIKDAKMVIGKYEFTV
ncbi:MAG TPA: type IV pilin N-terminal domain-containing protein [Methanospirillum sp.]|nr:type IV pilin N-terminal domain-containing protein [Methanospirillum sp.]